MPKLIFATRKTTAPSNLIHSVQCKTLMQEMPFLAQYDE